MLFFFLNQVSCSSFTDSVFQFSEQAFLGSFFLNPTKQFPTEYENKKKEKILFCLKFPTSLGEKSPGGD